MNNKKNYQKPNTKVIHLDIEQMIATSGINSVGYTDDAVDKDKEALGNGRRGSWGNLWD